MSEKIKKKSQGRTKKQRLYKKKKRKKNPRHNSIIFIRVWVSQLWFVQFTIQNIEDQTGLNTKGIFLVLVRLSPLTQELQKLSSENFLFSLG